MLSASMAKAPRKKLKTYNFLEEWEEEFIFTMVKDKCVCMLCHQILVPSKRENLEPHQRQPQQIQGQFPRQERNPC